MKEDLKELIQKHLPSLAAGEMKAFVEQAEKDKKDLQEISAQRDMLAKQLTQANIENDEFRKRQNDIDQKAKDLESAKLIVDAAARSLEVNKLKYELESEKKSKSDIFQLVNTFVSNTRAIELISKNKFFNHSDYWDGNIKNKVITSESETGTVEHTETK